MIRQQIVALLKKNARFSNEDIAKQLGVSIDDVSTEISAMESEGIIAGYTAIVNDSLLEENPTLIRALIELSAKPEEGTGFDSIASKISQFDEVVDLYLLSGSYDFHVVVQGKSLSDISAFVFAKLAPLESVESTQTLFIMKKYKEHGADLWDPTNQPRLAVSP